MTLIDRLERLSNGLADRDWLWWPLVRLRPARAAPFTMARALALAFATVLGGVGVVSAYRWSDDWPNPIDVLAVVGAIAFVLVGALFAAVAHFWSRRARRLGAAPTDTVP